MLRGLIKYMGATHLGDITTNTNFLGNSLVTNTSLGVPLRSIPPKNPDIGLSVTDLIVKYGYPVETHSIKTDDGYLLNVHRIPHGKNETTTSNNSKPVVFLMIGLLCSSVDWINQGPGKGLGYLLADNGYDVWMGNARGTTHSRKHVKYNPDRDHQFWDFSWHEIGIFDLPASIDYALNRTGHEKLHYVGHSQGTTSFFVMCSERPEYNNKIITMSALSPVAFMSHAKSPVYRLLMKFEKPITRMVNRMRMFEFLPHTQFVTQFGKRFCQDQAPTQPLCANAVFFLAGYDTKQLNQSMIPVITSNLPAGAATRQILHYVQCGTAGRFQKFDFGYQLNKKTYKQSKPPAYNLTKITAPVTLFYGANDWLASVLDVHILSRKLPNLNEEYKIKHPMFNHMDFLWAIDAYDLVYKKVLDVMKNG